MTGKSRQQKQRNEAEAQACQQRDYEEREALVQDQLAHRQMLQQQLSALRAQQQAQRLELHQSLVGDSDMSAPTQTPDVQNRFNHSVHIKPEI